MKRIILLGLMGAFLLVSMPTHTYAESKTSFQQQKNKKKKNKKVSKKQKKQAVKNKR